MLENSLSQQHHPAFSAMPRPWKVIRSSQYENSNISTDFKMRVAKGTKWTQMLAKMLIQTLCERISYHIIRFPFGLKLKITKNKNKQQDIIFPASIQPNTSLLIKVSQLQPCSLGDVQKLRVQAIDASFQGLVAPKQLKGSFALALTLIHIKMPTASINFLMCVSCYCDATLKLGKCPVC